MGRADRDEPWPVLDSGARGDVAQLEEHCVRIAGVRGSSPLISTKLPFSCSNGLAARLKTATGTPTRQDGPPASPNQIVSRLQAPLRVDERSPLLRPRENPMAPYRVYGLPSQGGRPQRGLMSRHVQPPLAFGSEGEGGP